MECPTAACKPPFRREDESSEPRKREKKARAGHAAVALLLGCAAEARLCVAGAHTLPGVRVSAAVSLLQFLWLDLGASVVKNKSRWP